MGLVTMRAKVAPQAPEAKPRPYRIKGYPAHADADL